jgi:hypothetical protein
MIQNKLITPAQVRIHKDICRTVNDELFNSLLLQTQIEDIAPLLGEDLFNDLLINTSDYNALMIGGQYVDSQGVTYTNYGLHAVIAYYWYARHTMFGDVKDTPFGQMTKMSGEGTAAPSQRAKDSLYQANRQTAFTLWKSVENYLIRTQNTLFLKNNCCQSTQKKQLKISILR